MPATEPIQPGTARAGAASRPGRAQVRRERPAPRNAHVLDRPTEHWVRVAARAAASKTDAEVVALEVGEVLGICGWFVICSGANPRQVRTLCDEVERQVAEAGGPKPDRIEGLDHVQWVLMDYGDFVVHVFHDDARRFYDLERLWADVPRLALGDPDPDAD